MTTKLRVSLLFATGVASIACSAESTGDPDGAESSVYCPRFEPNDRLEEASILERRNALAAVCPAGDEDYYAFDVERDQDVTVLVRFESPQSMRDLDLRLYDDSGALIDESATLDDFEFIQRTSAFSNRLPQGGYSFAVRARDQATQNDYAFVLTVE